jgi:hypothetical protein
MVMVEAVTVTMVMVEAMIVIMGMAEAGQQHGLRGPCQSWWTRQSLESIAKPSKNFWNGSHSPLSKTSEPIQLLLAPSSLERLVSFVMERIRADLQKTSRFSSVQPVEFVESDSRLVR